MQYNLCFDYVAIAVLLVMLFYFRPKGLSALPGYRIFYLILYDLLMVAVSNIQLVVYYTHPAVASRGLVFLANYFNCAVQILLITLFAVYLRCMTQVEMRLTLHWGSLLYYPFAVALLTLLVFAVRSYTVGENGFEFRRHPVLQVIFVAYLLYYLIISVVIGIRSYAVMGKERTMRLVVAAVLLEAVQLLQAVHHNVSIIVFISTFLIVDMLFAVQRAEEVFESADAMKKTLLNNTTEQDYVNNRKFFILFIRILDFDVLQDAVGQEDAEEFIRQLVSYLNALRRDAMIFRFEKNCLVLKLSDDPKEEKRKDHETIVQEIRERFEEPWRFGWLQSMLSAAFVTAKCPEDIPTMEDFRKLISRISREKLEMGEVVPARKLLAENEDARILTAIRRALKDRTFEVYYQPIYSTREKKVVAAEALIRLFDPEYGFIPPEAMITMAEREGYILEIGEIVFTEVCRFYSENHLDQKGIRYIEVNLSAVQCMQNRLAEEFMEIMRRFNMSFEKINFEITETSAMISNAVVSRNISHFELHGISLSLDDYGTGYSNISYLYNLPFMFMKIDKSILWSAENNEKADIILRNIFRMAQRLHLKVVMEGVETEEQIRKLLELKCDYFQGYYFSKPVCGKDFIEYVRNFKLPEICK